MMFKNAKLATLFFTMMVMMIGFGIIIPIMPFYIQSFGASGSQLGVMMAIFSLAQFISSPFWGSLSDHFGRKRIMMIGVLGNAISLIVIGFAQSFWVILVSRALEGLLSSATLPTAMAYISDSTSEEDRGGGMGVIGAAMGVGMVLGPGIGGLFAANDLSHPFFIAAGLSLMCVLLIWFILPESLPVEKRLKTVGRLRGVQPAVLWKALTGHMGFLFFLAFLVNFALANFEGIFGLYAGKNYGYGPAQVGTVLMVVGVVSSLVQALLTGPATRRLGEAAVIKITLLASALGFVFMVLVTDNALVVLSVGFFVFCNAMLRPSIISLTSKMSGREQGMTLGLNNSFQSLGRAVGPLWAGFTFDYNLHIPYLSAAFILVAAFFFALRTMPSGQVLTNQPPPTLSPDIQSREI